MILIVVSTLSFRHPGLDPGPIFLLSFHAWVPDQTRHDEEGFSTTELEILPRRKTPRSLFSFYLASRAQSLVPRVSTHEEREALRVLKLIRNIRISRKKRTLAAALDELTQLINISK